MVLKTLIIQKNSFPEHQNTFSRDLVSKLDGIQQSKTTEVALM